MATDGTQADSTDSRSGTGETVRIRGNRVRTRRGGSKRWPARKPGPSDPVRCTDRATDRHETDKRTDMERQRYGDGHRRDSSRQHGRLVRNRRDSPKQGEQSPNQERRVETGGMVRNEGNGSKWERHIPEQERRSETGAGWRPLRRSRAGRTGQYGFTCRPSEACTQSCRRS